MSQARLASPSRGKTIGLIGLVAFTYALTGKLGLLLSQQPGYATAVWLPSGIALTALLLGGARLAPGIFIGSFLANALVAYVPGEPKTLGLSLACATAIGGAATLQGLASLWMIRRWCGWPRSLAEAAVVVRLVLIGGPVACVIGATIGVTILLIVGKIDAAQLLGNWMTWWAGDTAGVFVITPAALALWHESSERRLRRFGVVGAPVAAAFILTIWAYLASTSFEQERIKADFEAQARPIVGAFEVATARYRDLLALTTRLFRDDPGISPETYRRVIGDLLPRYPGLAAIAWAPLVAEERRIDFLAQIRQVIPGFDITELDASGNQVPVAIRPFYAPVVFIEPMDSNKAALGFDLRSEPIRRTALERAWASGEPAATAKIILVQDSDLVPGAAKRQGMLVFTPVLPAGPIDAQPMPQPLGFVNGVFRIESMLASVLTPLLIDGMMLTVRDSREEGEGFHDDTLLFDSKGQHLSDKDKADDTLAAATAPFQAVFPLTMSGLGERPWIFTFTPTPEYLAAKQSFQTIGLLSGGLFLTGILGALLLIVSSRAEALKAEVGERTLVERALREREVELRRATSLAESASQTKSTFLANMSHEIRTPLGAVLGFSDLLSGDDLSPEERQEYAARIKRNGALLSNVIDDILDLSKVEAGKLEIDKRAVVVRDLVDDVVATLRLQAEEKGIALTVSTEADLPKLALTDPLRLRQILLNVGGNAVKFTERGSVDVTVRTNTPATNGSAILRFDVRDSGPGLTDEQASHIFLPFSQVDASRTRRHGGTGLGLVLSRRLARLLGGDVVLSETEPGRGSVFSVTIDAGRAEEGSATKVASRAEAYGGISLAGTRLLLVEDVADNRHLLGRFLTAAGAALDFAENGREAVAMAPGGSYDVILMDLQMPVMDGYEATSELRRGGYTGTIIALTAHALKEDRERCLASGFDDHISKPVDRHALLARVAEHCDVVR